MKRYITIGLFLISCICLVAQTTKTYNIPFNREDFTITQIGDFHQIESNKHDLLLEEDFQKPAIPYIITKVLLPDMQEMKSFSFNITTGQSEYNIQLCPNPKPIPYNIIFDSVNISNSYPIADYPFKVEYVGTGIIDGYHIADFKIFPISYNAYESVITWVTNIELSITTTPISNESETIKYVHKGNMDNILQDILLNPETKDYNISPLTFAEQNETIDYIIITSPELQEAFQLLKEWKNTKGIRTKIITTDSIYVSYPGNTNQLKVKNCIKYFHDHHNTEYVLLGGDDYIIPVQGCYGSVNTDTGLKVDSLIPTDLFYACLDEPFDWNPNGDNYIGHQNDSVDLDIDIFLTRLPVQTSDDVYAFFDKLLIYEQTPPESDHLTKMLLAGVSTGDTIEGVSGSEYRSRKMYNIYIKPYKNDKKPTFFYDTSTDFDGGENYDITAKNLQEQLGLGNGYHWIDMYTHGSPTLWNMEKGLPYYSEEALELYNPLPTIITTAACLTNAFDARSNPKYKSDPCLSEAFIRNPNSGVIAYFGGSRSGWYSANKNTIGTSMSFNARFYRTLFKKTTVKFGEIASLTKELSGKGGGALRWVLYSVNPIGDPEMPIYTTIPQKINPPTIIWNGINLQITSEFEDCSITITDKATKGDIYFQTYKNVQQASFSGLEKGDYTLCITKHNYIPYLATIKSQVDYIQQEGITDNRIYTGQNIRIGRNVTTQKPTGDVTIETEYSCTIDASNSVTIENGFSCKKGATLEIK